MNALKLSAAAAALAVAPWAVADPVNIVSYASLTGTEVVDFDDIAGGPAPGTNYDANFVSRGVGFGEHFLGQTVSFNGDFDVISGAPSGGSLTLVAGAPNQNLNVFDFSSNVLTGLGNAGYPNFNAIGEGAFSLTFSSGQSQFGFQLVGGDGGSAFISFYRADGSLISALQVDNLANDFYGFSREGGVQDIVGITIYNNDGGGIGFDNLKHDVKSAVPEPGTWALMLAGLAGVGGLARRRKA